MDYTIEEFETVNVNDLLIEYGDPETNGLTYRIIGAAMEVYNTLGKGFSETVYQDCLCIEFEQKKIFFEKEKKFEVFYKGVRIPHYYFADFVVEGKVNLEIKANPLLLEEHTKQVLNYLAASKCKVGLIINFGENSLKYKRIILTRPSA